MIEVSTVAVWRVIIKREHKGGFRDTSNVLFLEYVVCDKKK